MRIIRHVRHSAIEGPAAAEHKHLIYGTGLNDEGWLHWRSFLEVHRQRYRLSRNLRGQLHLLAELSPSFPSHKRPTCPEISNQQTMKTHRIKFLPRLFDVFLLPCKESIPSKGFSTLVADRVRPALTRDAMIPHRFQVLRRIGSFEHSLVLNLMV